ncbi:MAG: hypothetical protein ABJH08_12235 [Balneola sp.]
MRYLTTFLFTLLITMSVQAQDADSFFHNGANSFINSQLDQATQIVDEGLYQYPNDAKLNALREKLEEEKDKQKQQQQQQQQNQEQNEEEQEQEEQEQQQEQEQQEQEQQQQEEPKPQDGEEIDSKEISKEDAEKILKALAQKEKELLKDFKKKKLKDSATHDKDW